MSTHKVSNMGMWFAFMVYLCHIAHSLMELQSMEIVSCANKNICRDDQNLRIVLKASTIETSPGSGSISGIVTGLCDFCTVYESISMIPIHKKEAKTGMTRSEIGNYWNR
eukprot:153168_1